MLRANDLNLKQFGGNDSMKEAVKQMMIQHEIIFKSQVRELHRLYWTQKTLMRDLHRKEMEAKECSGQIGVSQSQARSTKEGNVGCLEESKGKFLAMSSNKQRGFNIELPASNYIRNFVTNTIGEGLSVGLEMVRPGSSTKSNIDKEKNLYCYEVIDLEEEPVQLGSDVEAYGVALDGSKIPVTSSHMASSSRVQKELGFVPTLNHLHVGCSKRWEEPKADHSGIGRESVAAVLHPLTASIHKPETSPSKPILFDLNIAQDEESSQALNDLVLTFSPPSSSSSVAQNELLWGLQINSCQKETSDAPLLTYTDQKQKHEEGNKVEGLSSGPNGELSNSAKGTAPHSSTGFSGLIEEENRDLSVTPSDNIQDKNEEDTVSSRVKALIVDSLVDGSTESSSLDKGVDGNSETTQLININVESTQNERQAVVEAANILANIYIDQLIEEDERDQPQNSADSFETMTLELPEVRSDEHLIVKPTKGTEKGIVNDEIVAVNNYKLRRGRGRAIRDFQKDILPGMVSLARHEICEDMHSIGYKLRKNGSKKGYGGNWFVPVKSCRSRRYPIGRRQ